jgi:two-component system chemotaxis response regulator CheB
MIAKEGDDGGASEPPAKRLIVSGASAGGVEAVTHLVAHLPQDLPAAVAVVVHHPVEHRSALARILARAGRLPAHDARDGELLRPGRILVAASAHHLVVQDGRTRLLDCARVNGVKLSIDPLFQSAALEYGRELVAVVLTGTYNESSAGLIPVRRAGGVGVVQDPRDAEFSAMPRNALDAAGADYVVSLEDMSSLLDCLARQGDDEVRRQPLASSPTGRCVDGACELHTTPHALSANPR